MVIFYNVSKWPAAGQGSLYARLSTPAYKAQPRLIAPRRSLGRLAKKRNDKSDEKPPLYYINCSQSKQLLFRSLRGFLDFNCAA